MGRDGPLPYISCIERILNRLAAMDAPPSTPTGLNEMHFRDGEFWLSWAESTDNVTPQDFIRYNVYVNGVFSDVLFGTGANSIN